MLEEVISDDDEEEKKKILSKNEKKGGKVSLSLPRPHLHLCMYTCSHTLAHEWIVLFDSFPLTFNRARVKHRTSARQMKPRSKSRGTAGTDHELLGICRIRTTAVDYSCTTVHIYGQ